MRDGIWKVANACGASLNPLCVSRWLKEVSPFLDETTTGVASTRTVVVSKDEGPWTREMYLIALYQRRWPRCVYRDRAALSFWKGGSSLPTFYDRRGTYRYMYIPIDTSYDIWILVVCKIIILKCIFNLDNHTCKVRCNFSRRSTTFLLYMSGVVDLQYLLPIWRFFISTSVLFPTNWRAAIKVIKAIYIFFQLR